MEIGSNKIFLLQKLHQLASKLDLAFHDHASEAIFWEQLYRRRQKVFLPLFIIVVALIPFLSARFVPHVATQMSDTMLLLDLLAPLTFTGIPAVMVCWRIFRSEPWSRIGQLISFACLSTGLAYALLCSFDEEPVYDFYAYSIANVLLITHLFLMVPVRHLVFITPTIVVAFAISTRPFTDPVPEGAMYAWAFVASLSAILLYAAFAIERVARQNHIFEQTLREEYSARRLKAQSREAWLSTMSEFLRDELGNALTAVRSGLQRVRRRTLPGDLVRYQERAEESARVMQRLLSEASAATNLESALSSFNPVDLDLKNLLLAKLEDYRLQYPDVTFEAGINRSIKAKADGDRIVQALDKLVNNAVEHSDSRTPIRIELDRKNSFARIAVINGGSSIEDPEKIFEPHISSKKSRENIGLGLFVVRRIANTHGGNVSARNTEDGSGVIFEIALPLVA